MVGYLFLVLYFICLQEYFTEVPRIDWSALLCRHFNVNCDSGSEIEKVSDIFNLFHLYFYHLWFWKNRPKAVL